MEKVISIIIPTYNMENYLRRCLDSLILTEEQMSLLEVLVINDGSKDSSSLIAHEYESRFPDTFRVIDKENGNYGSCVNRGLKEATGKYVKVLDADDWFNNESFKSFVTFLKDCSAECVLTDYVRVNQSGKVLEGEKIGLTEGFYDVKDVPYCVVQQLWMYQVTYRLDNLRKIEYHQTEGISYTDQEWIFLPLSTCKTWHYFPIILYCYLIGREGQTMQKSVVEKNLWMSFKGLDVMLDEYKKLYPGCSDEGKKILEIRLKLRIITLYNICYFQVRTERYLEILRQLDKKLANEFPDIVSWLNNVKGSLSYPYIKLFRKKFKRNYAVVWGHNLKIWLREKNDK